MKRVKASDIQVYNRLESNYHLSNKKALFINMKAYYTSISGDEQHVFKFLPVTFHIKDGLQDPEFEKFTEYYQKEEDLIQENAQKIKELKEEGKSSEAKKIKKYKNVWIIKPGENTNRGTGIIVRFSVNFRLAKIWTRSRNCEITNQLARRRPVSSRGTLSTLC